LLIVAIKAAILPKIKAVTIAPAITTPEEKIV